VDKVTEWYDGIWFFSFNVLVLSFLLAAQLVWSDIMGPDQLTSIKAKPIIKNSISVVSLKP
jgi:hypothetical protein